MLENKLLNVYGARVSKNGKHINLTLVEGEGDKKQFYTACVKIEPTDAKISGEIDIANSYAIINVPLLEGKKEAKEELNDEDLPF